MFEERKKAEERRKQEMKEYEEENKKREAEGRNPVESFDEWKKAKAKEEEGAKKEKKRPAPSVKKSSVKTSNSTPSFDVELDDEDLKILHETKKMGGSNKEDEYFHGCAHWIWSSWCYTCSPLLGYCYFNRQIDEEEKARLQVNLPVKMAVPMESGPVAENRALSEWNSGGTTYEERGRDTCECIITCVFHLLFNCRSDCSPWAHSTLSNKLHNLYVETPANPEALQQYIEVFINVSNCYC